ncbi:hypothetical protein L3X38_039087 [Prunus dulcis]|uniref:Uncharacterized protein n=1 Tax=Prunus dulcis TaxID=3755 RepID=A0AAD4V6E0_PRUDU|nr:hypothetical protein L3X38_039087 [Prunus dulcis]
MVLLEVERLHASVTKISKKYEHLHCKNIELEHDYRVLKHNWEMTHPQGTRLDHTQDVGHTQPNQPMQSSHSAPAQSRLCRGKGHLHPEST